MSNKKRTRTRAGSSRDPIAAGYEASKGSDPGAILHESAKLLRRYVEIALSDRRLYYLNEIREAIKWVEYAASRADEVLGEPSPYYRRDPGRRGKHGLARVRKAEKSLARRRGRSYRRT